jgi:hypothetical protein
MRNSKGEIAAGYVKAGARSNLRLLFSNKTLLFTFLLRSINHVKSLQRSPIIEWYLQVHIASILNMINKEYSQILFRRAI